MPTRIKNLYRDLFCYPQQRILPQEEEGAYWRARGRSGARELRPWQLSRARIIEKFLKEQRGKDVSIGDIGAGGGAMLRYLSAHASVASGVIYDYDEASLADATSAGIRAVEIDLQDSSQYARIEPADYYLLLEILEHLPRPEVLLADLRGKAARGIFFSMPNTGYIRHRFRIFLGKFPVQWIVHPGEHLRFWTIRDMHWWLAAQGITDYRLVPYRGVPILNKLWPNLFAAGMLICVSTLH